MDPKKRKGIRDSEKQIAAGTKEHRIPDSKDLRSPASSYREYVKEQTVGPTGAKKNTIEQLGVNRKYTRLERNPRNARSEEESAAIRKSTNRHFLNSANRWKPRIQEIQVSMEASPNPNITDARKSRANSKKPRLRDSTRGGKSHISIAQSTNLRKRRQRTISTASRAPEKEPRRREKYAETSKSPNIPQSKKKPAIGRSRNSGNQPRDEAANQINRQTQDSEKSPNR